MFFGRFLGKLSFTKQQPYANKPVHADGTVDSAAHPGIGDGE